MSWFYGRDCIIRVPVYREGKTKVPSFRTWKPNDPKQCPMCKHVGVAGDFEESEVHCEDCGDHPALKCRRCGEFMDMIYRKEEDFEPKQEGN